MIRSTLSTRWIRRVWMVGAFLLLVGAMPYAQAQLAIPDAPSAMPAPSAAVPSAEVQGSGGVSGLVKDMGGSPVGAAKVTLAGRAGFARATTTDADGSYSFSGLPAGEFTVTAKAEGFAESSAMVTLGAGEQKLVTDLAMRVEAKFQVEAISQVELADQQIKQEETQRVFGLIPNFYVAFDPNTVAMTTKQKAKLAGRTFIDPVTFIAAGIGAGINQGLQSPVDWGQDWTGFGQRYGAQMVGAAAGIGFSGFVFPAIFHQDPRYFYKGTGTNRSRVWWALKQAVEQKGDNGNWQPAYSNTLGDVASTLATVAVYPHRDVNWGATAGENFGVSIAGQAFGNLMEEFVVTKLTRRKKKATQTAGSGQ